MLNYSSRFSHIRQAPSVRLQLPTSQTTRYLTSIRMVQKFQLAAPRAELALPAAAASEICSLVGSADVLVRLLTVPIRPQSLQSPPALSRDGGGRTTQPASASNEPRDAPEETRGDR